MSALRLMPVYVLTWGAGGEGRTVTGLTLGEARDQAAALKEQGPAVMMQWPGSLTWAGSGQPVPEDHPTAAWLRKLDGQREGRDRSGYGHVQVPVSASLREWADAEMAGDPEWAI